MVFSLGLSQPDGCLVVKKRVELAGRAWQRGQASGQQSSAPDVAAQLQQL